MVSVLVVDDDILLGKALTRALRAHGFDSAAVGGYHEALTLLEQRPYDVLITDLRMGEKDGIDLLNALRESTCTTRAILMSAYATAKESQRALDLGAVRVLCKPFETRDVVEAIERAVDSSNGYVGVVHGLSLIDMLQMFHYGRRSLTLEVLGKTNSSVSMKDGEIIDARYGSEEGEAALRTILQMPAGSLKTRTLHNPTTSVNREFQGLLLDLLRELDEQSHASPSLPPASIGPSAPNGASKAPGDARRSSLKPPRSEVDAACQKLVRKVEGALACHAVDLQTGQIFGGFRTSDASEELSALTAVSVVHVFRGTLPDRPRRGGSETPPVEAQFDEFQLTSSSHIHFAKALANRRAIVMVTARRSANIALAWVQVRAAIAALDAVFPAASPRILEATNDTER